MRDKERQSMSHYESSTILEGAIEQPMTFGYSNGSYSGVGGDATSDVAVTKSSAASVLESSRPRLLLMPGLPDSRILSQLEQRKGGLQFQSEDEYREWLTANFRPVFEPYSNGMPNRLFIEHFAKFDLVRNAKLADLLNKIDRNQDGRVTWQEFFAFMTYRKRSEVSRSRRLLNSMVKGAAPAASKEERKMRRERDTNGEPIPEEAYLEFYNCRPPPIFIPSVLVAIWTFFIIYAVELNKGAEWNHVTWMGGVPYYSPLVFCPARRQEAWRFLSYMLLHVGWHHIIFNTAMTLLLGIPLELVHKAWRVAPIFLCGVLAGSLLSSVAEPAVTLMGASGGVYALIGAHYGLVLMNWEELQEGCMKCKRGPLSVLSSGVFRLVALTLLIGLDFGIALYRRYAEPNLRDSVSLTAHVAGLTCGLLVGIPLLKNIDVKSWERQVLRVAVVLWLLFLVFAMLWNIFYKDYPTSIPCNVGIA